MRMFRQGCRIILVLTLLMCGTPLKGERSLVFMTAGEQGLYRSTDGGRTWQTANKGLPPSIGAGPVTPVVAIAGSERDDRTVYCATEVDGIYRSEDQGQTWVAASAGLPVPLHHRTRAPLLAVDPGNSQWVYTVLTAPVESHRLDTSLYRSSDGGRNWTEIKELETDAEYLSLIVTSKRVVRLSGSRGIETIEDGAPEQVTPIPEAARALKREGSPVTTHAADRDDQDIAVLHDQGALLSRAFNLDRKSFEFRPTAAGSYEIVRVPSVFETDLGSRLELTDDSSQAVNLPFAFPFYLQSHQTAHVNSNGNITFVSRDTDPTETSIEFFWGRPKIAPLWDDFNPAAAGGVHVRSAADRVVVTWSQVPEKGATNSNTVQAVLFQDGKIRFSYNGIAAQDGLVGISTGSTASGFFVTYDEASVLTGFSAAPIHEMFSDRPMHLEAVAQRFYETHDDNYDALIVFGASELPRNLAGPTATATYRSVRNDVRGIGASVFNNTAVFGSSGRLHGVLNMNSLSTYPNDIRERFSHNNLLTVLGQEWGHRFSSYVGFRDGQSRSTALLGRTEQHWSYFFDSDASVMEGNDWRDNGDGSFTLADDTQRFGRLDQYLMGLRPASDVGTLTFVSDPQPLLTGTIGSIVSTFGRANNAIRDTSGGFGQQSRLVGFRLAIGSTASATITAGNTAAITSNGFTESATDPNVVSTASNLAERFGAQAGQRYSIVKTRDSAPQSRFFDSVARKFTGPNIVFRGTRRDISVAAIAAQEGGRIPGPGAAQTSFKHAFVLLVPKGKEASPSDVSKLSEIRRAWESFYADATEGRSTVTTSLAPTPVSELISTTGEGGASTYNTAGRTTGLNTGFARIDPGSEAVSGVAIFASRSGAQVVSEAGIPATPAITRARFFAERTASVNTGFAAVAPNAAAVLTLQLRDSSGSLVSTSTLDIPQRGHAARFLHELFSGVPPVFRGSVTMVASSPVAIVTLRTIVNDAGEFLITTLPAADMDSAPSSTELYLPQIADGGGYVTEVLLVNSGATRLTGTAEFRAPSGQPLEVTVDGVATASLPYDLGPDGSQYISTAPTAPTVRTGYLVIRPAPGGAAPIASAVFTLRQDGDLRTATGVTPASLTGRARTLADRRFGHDTGLAIVNPSTNTATVRISIAFLNGATATATLRLGAGTQTARFLSEIFQTVSAVSLRGNMLLESDFPVAIMSLRSTVSGDRFLLSTLPVEALDATPPVRVLYFPHLVDGSGFSTELALLNLSRNITTSLVIFFWR